MFGFDRIRLQLFARRGGRNYMMRSEKRPSYNYTQRPRKPKRRRTRYAYLVLTLLVSILLWPVGLFLIWNRRLRCKVGGKILWSAATLAVFCCLVLALLTVPTNNEQFQRFQDDANDLIATVGADLEIAWQTFSERSGDAWGNMRTVGYSVGNFALNKTADGLEAGVALAENVRNWVGGLFPAGDEQTPSTGLEATNAPEETPGASAPAQTAQPSATPATTPITRLFATPEPSDAPSAAELAVSGLALARAGMNGAESGAPEASSTPYPTPTTRPQASAEAEPSAEPSELPQATGEPEATGTPQATAEAEAQPSTEPVSTVSAEPAVTGAEETQATPQPARAMPTPTPAAELPEGETVEAKPAGDFIVYHTENGRWYHTTATCSGMRDAQEYTFAQSVEDGFEPCPDCGAPAAELLESENVVWVDEDSVYHISDECSSFVDTASLMTLEDAVDAQCVPCAACGANALADGASEAQTLDEEALLELARDVTVYFYDGSVGYHAESSCYGMSGAPARTLYEAIEMDKPPCSRCNPPTLEDLG